MTKIEKRKPLRRSWKGRAGTFELEVKPRVKTYTKPTTAGTTANTTATVAEYKTFDTNRDVLDPSDNHRFEVGTTIVTLAYPNSGGFSTLGKSNGISWSNSERDGRDKASYFSAEKSDEGEWTIYQHIAEDRKNEYFDENGTLVYKGKKFSDKEIFRLLTEWSIGAETNAQRWVDNQTLQSCVDTDLRENALLVVSPSVWRNIGRGQVLQGSWPSHDMV